MTKMFKDTPTLSDSNKGKIHNAFSTNPNWPYDWSVFVSTAPPNQTGDNNQINPPVDANHTHTDHNTPPVVGQPAPVLYYRPLPQTMPAQALGDLNYTFWGMIMADGGSPVTQVAFELADNMLFRNSTLHPATLLAGSPNFSLTLRLEEDKRYYYRAVATNAVGSTRSSPKRLDTPSSLKWWSDSFRSAGGWRTSSWFGTFRPHESGCVYHLKLGWAYAHPDGSGGLWLWFKDHRWMWTQEGVFPYFFKHQSASWHYLSGSRNGQPVFFEWKRAASDKLP